MSYKSLVLGLAAVCGVAAEFPMQVRVAHHTPPACCVAVGPEGVVYAGTSEGLMAYRDGRWSAVESVPHEPVSALTASELAVAVRVGGAVYLLSDGQVRLEAVGAVFALDGRRLVRAPQLIPVVAMAVGPNGASAVAARDGLYEQTDGRDWQRIYPAKDRAIGPRQMFALSRTTPPGGCISRAHKALASAITESGSYSHRRTDFPMTMSHR